MDGQAEPAHHNESTNEPDHNRKYQKRPWGFAWRSNTFFIISTIGIGIFTDLFLYGLVVPILPFLLRDRISVPEESVQNYTSGMLTAYAAASVLVSPFAGVIADRTKTRQRPFIGGLIVLILATVLFFLATSLPLLILARIGQGASSAFVWTVGLAMCIDTVGPENLGKVIGTIFSFVTVGELIAPVVGGVLYSAGGMIAVGGVSLAIIVIDLIMRLLVIEKQTAQRYLDHDPDHTAESDSPAQPDETSRLLPNGHDAEQVDENDPYYIKPDQPWIIRLYPILYCLSSPSLVVAQIIGLVQAIVVASFDATIPIHAKEVYHFDSLKSGLLFIPLGVLNCIFGPLSGWAVDRYGTKPVAVSGFLYLCPALALLRIPQAEPFTSQVILYAVLLGLCGIGSPVIGSPSIVEAGSIVDKYYKRNPKFFGAKGPYAQLYGINSMMFCTGLSVGPVIAGVLNKSIGYGNMNAVLAAICFVAAGVCFIWFGPKPKIVESVEEVVKHPQEGLFRVRSRSSAVYPFD